MPFPLPLFLALGAGAALLALGKKGAAKPAEIPGGGGGTVPGGETPGGEEPGGEVPGEEPGGEVPSGGGGVAAPTTPTGLGEAVAAGKVDEVITKAVEKKNAREQWAVGLALTKESDPKLQSKGQLLCAIALQTGRKDGTLTPLVGEIVARDNNHEVMTAIYAAELLAKMPEEKPYQAVWIALSSSLKALHGGKSEDAAEAAATTEAAKDASDILNSGLAAATGILNEALKGAGVPTIPAPPVVKPPAAPAPAPAPSTTLPNFSAGSRTLKLTSPPMKGTDVRHLQSTLNDQYRASPKLTVDGIFGSGTKAAVVSFQGRHYDASGKRLVADGIVGASTWWSLKNGGGQAATVATPIPTPTAPAPIPSAGLTSYAVGSRTLRLTSPYMKGTDVRDLQGTLNDQYGASPKLTVDGVFGAGTKAAVVQFQRGRFDSTGKALATDGVVGSNTWWALRTGGGKASTAAPSAPSPVAPAPIPSPGLTSYAVGSRTLKLTSPYMKGTDVRDLQGTLNDQYRASPKLVVDGVFGAGTKAAVIAFQKGRYDSTGKALAVDGVVGANTWWALRTGGGRPATTTAPAPVAAPAPAPSGSTVTTSTGPMPASRGPDITLKLTSPYMRGPKVVELQELINWRGYRPILTTDGIFGPNTQVGVKAFQIGHNDSSGAPLVADGIVGPKTWGSLRNTSSVPTNVSGVGAASQEAVHSVVTALQRKFGNNISPSVLRSAASQLVAQKIVTLHQGMKSKKVAQAQLLLNRWLGAKDPRLVLKPDGMFGPKTQAAAKLFQKAHGLHADGIIGPRTWSELRSIRL